MTNSKDAMKTLHDIKNIMEKSTKFSSISGLSFISAGTIALTCAFIVSKSLNVNILDKNLYNYISDSQKFQLIEIGFITLILAVLVALYFTYTKAKKNKVSLLKGSGLGLALHFGTPLAIGGVTTLTMLYYQHAVFVAPLLLIFYGLGIVSGSKFTHPELIYLGWIELILGCLGLFYLGHGLVIWSLGFGVAHILWGIYFYIKHD